MSKPMPPADTPPAATPAPEDHPEERLEERLAHALHTQAVGAGLLRPVDAESGAERRLWRASELAIFLAHRLPACPDPRRLSERAVGRLARRWLVPGECLSDPAEMDWYRPYWVLRDGRRIGTLALWSWDQGFGVPNLWLSSVSIFPDARGAGEGTRLMGALDGMVRRLGFGALRLETDWLWQRSVRFYLRQGFRVANWKRGVSLIRRVGDPPYRVRKGCDTMEMILPLPPESPAETGEWAPAGSGPEDPPFEGNTEGGGDPAAPPSRDPLAQDDAWSAGADAAGGAEVGRVYRIVARRRGNTLLWEEHPPEGAEDDSDFSIRLHAAATFALWLGVSGWPLVRGPQEWARRGDWCDVGMPEGLARKIQIFEALARREGVPVRTPRIPGLDYPDWDDIE